MWGSRSRADIDAELDAIAGAGGRIIRFDVGWASFEYEKGRFSSYFEDRLDYIVEGALNREIEPQLVILSTPAWANGGKGLRYPPTDPDDISGFIYNLVDRYRGRVRYFEIWNEPDVAAYWPPGPNAGQYMSLLRVAYTAAKRANPNAVVISGGLVGNDTSYLQSMYDAGARDYFDRLGLHLYSGGNGPYEPEQPYNARWNYYGIDDLKAVMDANGDRDKHIWMSEFGWQTSTGGLWPVSEAVQAQYVGQAYQRLFEDFPYIDAMCLYDVRDDGTNPANPEHRFGFLRHNYSRKPAYYTYLGSSRELWPSPRLSANKVTVGYLQNQAGVYVTLPSGWGESSVTIQSLGCGLTSWTDVLSTTSTQTPVSAAVRPVRTTLYRALVPGREVGQAVRIRVRPYLRVDVRPAVVRPRTASTFTGRLLRAPGALAVLQRKSGRRWVNVRLDRVDRDSKYAFAVRHLRRGRFYYRVRFSGTAAFEPVTSRIVCVLVR